MYITFCGNSIILECCSQANRNRKKDITKLEQPACSTSMSSLVIYIYISHYIINKNIYTYIHTYI